MYKILKRRDLAENIFEMQILAPRVAKKCLPGQFVILRVDEKGERIPLTISDYDRVLGSVNIVVQVVGASTYSLSKLNVGDCICDFLNGLFGMDSRANFSGLSVKFVIWSSTC